MIHTSAVVSEDVLVGNGTVILDGSVINAGTVISKGCINNTCTSVDHGCSIADFEHVSVWSHVAGIVSIDEKTGLELVQLLAITYLYAKIVLLVLEVWYLRI